MPRARRRPAEGRQGQEAPVCYPVDDMGSSEADPRKERTRIFSKTKMCKFFILNCCSRGDQCHFAHSKDQLAQLPDLFRTKLCRTLINTGVCNDPDCRYAHSKDELRNVDGFVGTLTAEKTDNTCTRNPDGPAPRFPDGPRQPFGSRGPPQMHLQPSPPHLQQPQPQQHQPPHQVAPQHQPQQQQQQHVPQPHHQQQPPLLQQAPQSVTPQEFQTGTAANEAALQQQMAALGHMAQVGLSSPGSLEQMMMLHMGQAAQAHVAEAVRLQAMAACLQAAGGFSPGAAFMSPTGGGSPTTAAATAAAFGGLRPTPGMQHNLGEQQMQQLAAAVHNAPGLQQQGGYSGAATGGAASGYHHQRRHSGASTASVGSSRTGGAQGVVSGHMRQGSGGGHAVGHTRQSSGGSVRQGSEGGAFATGGAEAAAAARLRNGKVVGALADPPSADLARDLAAEEGGFAPSEPAQINFSSLRSLSSQSLSRLAEEAENVAAAESLSKEQVTKRRTGSEDGVAENFGWRVKNTFLDFEAASTPLHGRLRTVCSAAGRLDALGEEPQEYTAAAAAVAAAAAAAAGARGATKTPSPPASPWTGPQPQQGRTRSGSNPPALHLVPENSTRDFGGQDGTPPGPNGRPASGVAGGSDTAPGPPMVTLELEQMVTEKRSQDTPLASRHDALPGSLGTAGFTVKNTFLDFEEPVRSSLRVVHTAAGRLDLMGQE